MGNSPSAQTNNNNRGHTNSEIKQNIQQLFNLNKNNFVNTSYSLDESIIVTPESQVGGNNFDAIRFQSSKNRHLRHNIEDYVEQLQKQYGGENNEQNENANAKSEFDKIKQYLLNDLHNEQNGGNDNVESTQLSNMSYSITTPKNNDFSFLNMLGGVKNQSNLSSESLGDDMEHSEDLSNSEKTETPESRESSELSESKESNDTPSSEISDDNTTNTFSNTSSEKIPVEHGFNSSTSYSTTQQKKQKKHNKRKPSYTSSDVSTPYIIQNTDSSLDSSISLSGGNDDATNSQSSELNIIPFYSTESSNRHPYIAKRFRK